MNREDFIITLIQLKEQDPDAFMQLMLDTIKRNPELAISDSAPTPSKIEALTRMLRHLEQKENFEDCVFIRDLANEIEHGKKD